MPDSSDVHEDGLLSEAKITVPTYGWRRKKKLADVEKIWDNNYVTETDTVVEKFNPNHDEAGKFASGTGATTVTFEGDPADVAAVKPNAEAALAAINAVVDVPLKSLTIVAKHDIPNSDGGTVNGFYQNDAPGQLTINAARNASTQQSTIIHEFGHLLEYEFMGNGKPISQENLPPSYKMMDTGDDPWGRLGTAMAGSQRMQMIFMNAQVFNDPWSVYAADPSEAFARAFAQYVGGSKGGNSTMRNFLASQDGINGMGQWDADDFTGVGEAVGNLLAETGVGSASTVTKFNQNHDENGRFSSGVGGRLSVTYTGDPEKIEAVKPQVEAALGIINSTVTIPGMKTLKINVTDPESQGIPHEVRGWYTPGENGVLNVSSHMDDPDMTRATILHEFGHMLDFEHLSRKGLLEGDPAPSYKMTTDPPGTAWSAFGREVMSSKRAKSLVMDSFMGNQWAAYAISPHETFGRAFMQYAVNHSNDTKLKMWQQSYDAVQKSGQWFPGDFEGIDTAMGNLLESEGVKAAGIAKFNHNHDENGRFSSGPGGSLGQSVHPAEGDLADMRASSITSKYVRADGSFTPERAALHDKIVSDFLRGVPSRENPVEYFNGGGPGAGKSSMTQGVNGKLVGYPGVRHVDDATGRMDFKGVPTPDAVLIDPDAVKLQLPEVQKMLREGDQTWAAEAHAESSYLSKRVMQAALDRKVHIVNDGTGDSGAAKMIAKAHQAKAAGYRTEANYLHLDPNEGVRRALARAKRSGRMVPPTVIRHTYAALPEVFGAIQEGVFDNVRLFDNDGVGVGQPARLIGATNNGHFEIFDQTAYERFMAGN